jgi:hypothetical protein
MTAPTIPGRWFPFGMELQQSHTVCTKQPAHFFMRVCGGMQGFQWGVATISLACFVIILPRRRQSQGGP